MVDASEETKGKVLNSIFNAISADDSLRSKRELIEKFIKNTIPKIHDSEKVGSEFESFWADEKVEAFKKMCEEEGILTEKLQGLIDDYLYTGRKPRRGEIAETLKQAPKILERDSIISRISKKLDQFISIFIEGI